MEHSRRAFTLIELSVVLVIIIIFASLIGPNLVGMRKSQDARFYIESVRRTAERAKQIAISDGRTTTLNFDQGQGAFVLTELANTDPQGTTNTSTLSSMSMNQNVSTTQDQTIETVPSVPEITTGIFSLAGKASSAGDWKLHFYSDGTSEGGYVELDGGNNDIKSLYVKPDGTIQIIQGQAPDSSTETWPAGTYVQRS